MTDPSGVSEDQNSESTEPVDNSKRYLVKVPWHTSVLHDPDGTFPDITPQGVEMSADEREAAKKAAKTVRIRLLSKEV